MHTRGLRADLRRDGYRTIVDGARTALAAMQDAHGRPALTAFEAEARWRRKSCRIFRAEGRAATICERCGHDYLAHREAAARR